MRLAEFRAFATWSMRVRDADALDKRGRWLHRILERSARDAARQSFSRWRHAVPDRAAARRIARVIAYKGRRAMRTALRTWVANAYHRSRIDELGARVLNRIAHRGLARAWGRWRAATIQVSRLIGSLREPC